MPLEVSREIHGVWKGDQAVGELCVIGPLQVFSRNPNISLTLLTLRGEICSSPGHIRGLEAPIMTDG
jgi:hypothetical protein